MPNTSPCTYAAEIALPTPCIHLSAFCTNLLFVFHGRIRLWVAPGLVSHLIVTKLACSTHEVDVKYYADGEDAFAMRKYFKEKPQAAPGTKAIAPAGNAVVAVPQ